MSISWVHQVSNGEARPSPFHASTCADCDVVTLTDGVTTRTHVVQNLSITAVDPEENTVTGIADAGRSVSLWSWEDPEGRRLEVTADDSGNWAADFDDVGFDLKPGYHVRAEVWDDDGDATAVDWEVPIRYDIYAFDALTGETSKITNLPDTDEYNPSWSPNGKKVAHDVVRVDSHSIYITDVKTGVSAPLAGAEDGGNDAVWSQNGKWIVFDRVPAGDASLYLVQSNGGVSTLVRKDAVSADWAPNGKRLIFQQPSDGSIRTIPMDGGRGGETLIAEHGANPAWSPDGNWIAYENDGDIWKVQVNVQGRTFGDPIQLTSGPFWDGQPTWSVDSQTIVYHSGLNRDWDLWSVPAAGGEPTWLTGALEFGDYDPAYARNSSMVAYASFSPARQAARQWVAVYKYDLLGGAWSEGAHSYYYGDNWGHQGEPLSFTVSSEVPFYDGYVLIRPGAVWARGDEGCQVIDTFHPDQATRFHAGWPTSEPMTYEQAVEHFSDLIGWVAWDGGEQFHLPLYEIRLYSSDTWQDYFCSFTEGD